jgi:hypothetical protein
MPKKSWSVIWTKPGTRAMPTAGTNMDTVAIRAHPRNAEAEATEACPDRKCGGRLTVAR